MMNNEPISGAKVLVVDDHDQARESTADVLRHAGHTAVCCSGGAQALARLDEISPDVILTDLQMPGMSGLEFIRELQKRNCEAQIVMVTAYASVSTAVEAMRNGAFDYIEKPFDVDQLEQLIARALRHGDRVGKRSAMPDEACDAVTMIGNGPAMRALREQIAQIATTSETVLIVGESGTGKELVAKSIHAASSRRHRALVSVNCPALSPQLMESELFGHERGAFTSADAPRVGRFELADGGTILLDEVTEIDLPLQAKLLRVLQERSFERVGSSRTQPVDVRVVAATNRDLAAEVQAGRFRRDLYYRLAVVPIQVPSLRDRAEDVPELANYFLRAAARRLGRSPHELTSDAVDLLTHHAWPGNVRELQNLMTRASVLAVGRSLRADDLRAWIAPACGSDAADPVLATSSAPAAGEMRLDDMERRLIEAALERFDGHREKTAKALGIGVRTLTNKLRQYGYGPRAKVFAKAA